MEEQDYGEDINPGGIREYLALYRIFSENITSVLKTVVSDDASQASMMDSETVLHELVLQIPRYDVYILTQSLQVCVPRYDVYVLT